LSSCFGKLTEYLFLVQKFWWHLLASVIKNEGDDVFCIPSLLFRDGLFCFDRQPLELIKNKKRKVAGSQLSLPGSIGFRVDQPGRSGFAGPTSQRVFTQTRTGLRPGSAGSRVDPPSQSGFQNYNVNLPMTLKFMEFELVTFKKLSYIPLSFIRHYFFF
jgi:hypothetical protein